MAPMTALRMVDIHSSAARLLPKPMLPNAANSVRMIIRRQKRASTWVDLSSCGRFGSCAKCQGLTDTPCAVPDRDAASCDIGWFAPSGEIVGEHRLVERARGARHRGRWSCSTAQPCAGPRRTRSKSPAANPDDGPRSIDRANPEARARATARNTTRPRHRRCGEPAIAAVPDRSAPAPHRSRRRSGSNRSIRAVFSDCPIEGKRRQVSPITSATRSAVAAWASRSRSLSSRGSRCSLSSGMTSSHIRLGRDLQPHRARWSKRHLKTRWGRAPRYRDFISAGGEG